MDDIKLFVKNEKKKKKKERKKRKKEKKWKPQYRQQSDEMRMEFGIEKCAMLIMKSEKQQMTERFELSNQEKPERSDKRKLTNIWDYWKRTPSIKRR